MQLSGIPHLTVAYGRAFNKLGNQCATISILVHDPIIHLLCRPRLRRLSPSMLHKFRQIQRKAITLAAR